MVCPKILFMASNIFRVMLESFTILTFRVILESFTILENIMVLRLEMEGFASNPGNKIFLAGTFSTSFLTVFRVVFRF